MYSVAGAPGFSVEVSSQTGALVGQNAYFMDYTSYSGSDIFNNKENEMTKFYKVVKDHPYWEVGAIIKKTLVHSNGNYASDTDLFDKAFPDEDKFVYYEIATIVEHSDWFERVYQVNTDDTTQYLSKTDAQAAATASTTPTTTTS